VKLEQLFLHIARSHLHDYDCRHFCSSRSSPLSISTLSRRQCPNEHRTCTRLLPYPFEPCGWESCNKDDVEELMAFCVGFKYVGLTPQFSVLRPNPPALPIPVLVAILLLQHEDTTVLKRRGITAHIAHPCPSHTYSRSLVSHSPLLFFFADQSPHRSSAPQPCHPPPHSASIPKEVIPICISKQRRLLLNTKSPKRSLPRS
jgi:hypothetical protein